MIAKGSALIYTFKLKNYPFVKMTILNSATHYPINFEKLGVSLTVIVFNEEIVAILELTLS